MADINDKVVTDSVLKKAITDVLQIVAENVYIDEEYTSSQIDNMFDGTAEEIAYYSSLINDNLVSENRLYSSKKIADEIAKAVIDSNAYADGLIKDISSIQLEWCDTSLPTTGESNKIYILPTIVDSNTVNTLNIWNTKTSAYVSIGNLDISLDGYVKTQDMNTALDTKANDNEVLKLDNILTTTGNETHDNVYSAKLTKTELDKKANDSDVVKKTDIATSIDNSSTDNTVPTSKAVETRMSKREIIKNVDLNTFVDEGKYYIASGCTNSPIDGGYLNIMRYDDDFVCQICARYYISTSKNMYIRTKVSGTWGKWQRVCTTSVADVGDTMISSEDSSITGTMAYLVKNGKCYVTIWGVSGTTLGNDYIVCSSMPKCRLASGSVLCAAGADGSNVAFGHVQSGETSLKINIFKTNITFFGSFSYPVAE